MPAPSLSGDRIIIRWRSLIWWHSCVLFSSIFDLQLRQCQSGLAIRLNRTIPIVGDWDGDGRDDYGCYHPPSGMWYRMMSKSGFSTTQFGFGGTTPIVGDWDGDGLDDYGCYHPPSGMWYRMMSSSGFFTTQFGFEGTMPVVR